MGMYGSRAVTLLVLISDDVINRILKLDIQTNILVYVTRCCTDLTSKVLKERTFGQSSAVLYMLNSKNSVFDPYFLIGTGPMRKTLVRIIRELKLLSFSWKKYYFLSNFFLAIFMGNPSLRLSEVLQ